MNKLKMFVNNPELWESFVEELEARLEANHKQLEQINEQGLDAWKKRIAQIKADNPKES